MTKFTPTYADQYGRFFGRINENGDVAVLYENNGEVATRLACPGVYPVDSQFGTRYEHPNGIVITLADARKIGLRIER